MRRLSSNQTYVLLTALLVLVLAIIHRNWIFSLAPLVSGDWPYFYPEQLKAWFPFHPLWITYDGLGRTISQGNFVFLFSVFGWLARLGANFELISRLLFFLPVLILAPLTSFLAVRELTKDKVAAIVGAFVYSCNTYFIVIQGGHMHLSMTYALAPLVYYFAMREAARSYFWLFVVLSIIGLYDIRMTLVIGLLGGIIALFHKVKTRADFGRYVRNMALGAGGFLVFHSFWILPAIFTKPGYFAENVFAQRALNWVTQLDAFALHHPFWSSQGVTDFVFQPVSFYVYLLPIFAFLPFVLPRIRVRRELVFYGSVTLFSMLLLLQENSLLGDLYRLIYERVPLMSMFRESTKMFFVTSFGFSVLIGYLLAELAKSKLYVWRGLVIFGLLVVVLVPIKTYLSGNFVKTYQKEPVSQDMKTINAQVTGQSDEYYRNLWVSRVPKFAATTPQNPSLDVLGLGNFWGDDDQFDSLGYLRRPNFPGLLKLASVRHVIVPSDTVDANYKPYNFQTDEYYRNIVDKWGLRQTDQVGDNTIWENDGYKPRMYFSTDTTLAGSVKDFSGIDENKTAAYLFQGQQPNKAQRQTLTAATHNVELSPFKPDDMQIEPGRVVSTLNIPEDKLFTLYQKDNPQEKTFTAYEQFDPSQPVTQTSELISGINLYGNGSFEEDRPVTLIDAHNYDNTSLEQNNIKSRLVDDATDGEKGLEITAGNHIADLTQQIQDFDKNSHYLVSLDYKYISGPAPSIALTPFDQRPFTRKAALSTDKQNEWTSYQTIVQPGHLTDNMHLLVYVPTTSHQTSKLIVDNIRVFKLPYVPQAYLRTTETPKPAQSFRTLESKPTKHVMQVDGLTDPRLFVFSETYDPNWKLTLKKTGDNKSVTLQDKDHVIANGFANSWWIDTEGLPADVKNDAGAYEITLEYMPERWFYVGGIMSGLLVIGCGGYLLYKKRWSKS